MRGIADQAGVSVKTVEALYRTKAELLKQVIDYAIAGDLRPIPILARESVAAIQAAPDAPAMLDLHARHHARGIAERAATILWVVEQAAPTHEEIARLSAQNSDNRRTGARWAATTLLSKPDVPPPHHPALRRRGVLDRHRSRHLPQPHPRARPQPTRVRILDQRLLPQNAPPLI